VQKENRITSDYDIGMFLKASPLLSA